MSEKMTEKNLQKVLWMVLAVLTLVQAVIRAKRDDPGFSLLFVALSIAFTWQTVRMFRKS